MRWNAAVLTVAALAWAGLCLGQGGQGLRVGAARVVITPPADAALPMSGFANRTQGFKGIHDDLHVRAIVLDDGARQAALLAWELIFVPDAVWAEVARRVMSEADIPPDNLLLAAVHTHGAPALRMEPADSPAAVYTREVISAAVDAVRRAKASLRPARMGAAYGVADINVHRREVFPGRGVWLGFNEKGPSDKTVAVVRFEDLAGRPVAMLVNYAVHAVVMGSENLQITADVAGATSRFVERHYAGLNRPRSDAGPRLALRTQERVEADPPVVVWTSGAAGDQNPVAMADGEDFTLVDALGRILGESVVRTASGIQETPQARIRAGQMVVTCPGRKVEDGPRPRAEYKFTDADPVSIRLSLLRVGDVALAGVSGEVLTGIHQRLRKVSPLPYTIMVTHANGSSGYIPDDASFDPPGYEGITSRLKPGCAENAIVQGLLELMQAE